MSADSVPPVPPVPPVSPTTPTDARPMAILTPYGRRGLIVGAVIVFLGLVGLLEAFSTRSIINVLRTEDGKAVAVTLLSLPELLALIVAFVAVRGLLPARPRPLDAIGAVGCGAVASAVTAAFVRLGPALGAGGDGFQLREVFIHATPDLFEVLGSFAWHLPLAALAAVAVTFVRPDVRRALAAGAIAVALVGVLSDHVTILLDHNGVPRASTAWFLRGKSLTVAGAATLFGCVAALRWLGARYRPVVDRRLATRPAHDRRWLRRAGIALAGVALIALPRFAGSYHSEVLNQVGLFVLMGLGLNIVVGFAGMLDLGYVAFFALGAYTMGVLTSPESFLAAVPAGGGPPVGPVGFWLALPVCIVVAVIAGTLLGVPVLSLRGDYLAIVTLGFGEIIRVLALSEWLKPFLGGSLGLKRIPPIKVPWLAVGEGCAARGIDVPLCIYRAAIDGPDKPQKLFYILLAGCVVAAFVALRLKDSRHGRAWMALREDEDVAQAMGVDLVRTKLMAFAIGAAFSGLSGAIFAPKLVSIFPHSFNLLISINILALIIVGGMGSIPGVIVGALALVGLPELLREFAEYRLWAYGIVLVAMMLYRPEGMIPSTATLRELRPDDDAPAGDAAIPSPAGPGTVTAVAGAEARA
ncbi:MAG: leucine/isoleucine/valine transporter permease subunit [Ardenticatenales bacterium]|nr:leucine/isoleucine/valine transporter permease subunit [Ardenticatenales bacterium]